MECPRSIDDADFDGQGRSDVPDLLEHFGFESVIRTIKEDDREAERVTTISIATTSQPDLYLVIVTMVRYR